MMQTRKTGEKWENKIFRRDEIDAWVDGNCKHIVFAVIVSCYANKLRAFSK